ncbi:hypothetical protein CFAM422_002097 [Trichoderma lentiforme]|uniref:Secreted protein n=1 Tax=Trichoderma lentiforme TaxID=1567552 RepID=A0A9P5CEZ2_9HYPO|nr:hypothetical protein CFAM422_002097 [Trichoderma lentiforme]
MGIMGTEAMPCVTMLGLFLSGTGACADALHIYMSSITATFFPPSSMESRSILALAAAVLASSDESSKILKKL